MADLNPSKVSDGHSDGTLNGQQQVQSVVPLICYICPETPKFAKKSELFEHLLGIRHKTMVKKASTEVPELKTPHGRFLAWWRKYHIDQELKGYCAAKEESATEVAKPTKTMPKICYICTETTEFSDQQHLIKHLLSDKHCNKFRESLSGNSIDRSALTKFMAWYHEHDIALLLKPHREGTTSQRVQVVDKLADNHQLPQNSQNGLQTAQKNVTENRTESIPLVCLICPGQNRFSDQAQLIEHLDSESHLSQMARLSATRGTPQPDPRLRQWDEWFFKHKIGEKLMAQGKIKYGPRQERASKAALGGSNIDALDDGRYPSPVSVPTRSSYDTNQEAMAKQDWNATRHSDPTSDEIKLFNNALSELVTNWLKDTPAAEANLSELLQRKDCDVEPETGRLLDPILYPRTLRAHMEDKDKDKASLAATERIRAYFAQHPERFLRYQDSKLHQLRDKKAQEEIEKEAQSRAAWEAETAAQLAQEAAARRPQIRCHFRPAEPRDVKAITDLYNKEVSGQSTVMELEHLPSAHVQNLLRICNATSLPFAVAIEGDSANLDIKKEKLIGFAMIIQGTRGFTGLNNVMGKVGGKLVVVVDEAFRRKKIGSALIHLVLTSCSRQCPEQREGYDFINPKKIKGLEEAGAINFFYIDVEVIVRSGNTEKQTQQGERFQGLLDALEGRFCILLFKYEHRALHNGLYYFDKATFRHWARNLSV
ncbi:hypothetical protein GGR57DRAFT_350019 [Xylariaceae sp. FL1272]|nr:hypothetical protein GGR57DRAFT_350019 [Xylariaceae sp. FL1272]